MLCFILVNMLARANSFPGRRKPELESTPSFEEKASLNPSSENNDAAITALEIQLHEKDIKLRELQASLLQHGRPISAVILTETQIRDRFSRLSSAIQDFVETHFESAALATEPSADILSTLSLTQSTYSSLLEDPWTKLYILRGLIAGLLARTFTSGQLLGNEAFWELKQAIGSKGEPDDKLLKPIKANQLTPS